MGFAQDRRNSRPASDSAYGALSACGAIGHRSGMLRGSNCLPRNGNMGLEVTGRFRYPPPREPWLARHQEPILEPHLPIIDAHHHIWEEPESHYLLEDLMADTASGHRIVATVFVQAYYGYRIGGPEELRCVGETDRITAMRAIAKQQGSQTDVAAGIVGFANLCVAN